MTATLPAAISSLGGVAPVVPSQDPYWVYLDTLNTADSRRTMQTCLNHIAQIFTGDPAATGEGKPWHLLRYEHTTNIAAQLKDKGWAPAYVNKHLTALRQVLEEAWNLGLMTGEDYKRAAAVKNLKYSRLPAGQHVPGEVVGAVLAACDADESSAGRRDSALLATLYSTGCRRAEVAALALADYDGGERSLLIHGKGDKQRRVWLTTTAVGRMEAWLAERGHSPGPLFVRINKSGKLHVVNGRLAGISGQAIADILDRRLLQAGASRRTPHDLRRTFIGELLDAGADLATTQELAGHASPNTTAAYDRRPDRVRRAAVDKLPNPAPRPLRVGKAGRDPSDGL